MTIWKFLNQWPNMNIDTSYILPVAIAAVVSLFITLGALLIVKSYNNPLDKYHFSFIEAWRLAISGRALTAIGIMPFLNVVLFYGFIMHVRWSLGRWPNFGEELTKHSLTIHIKLAEYCVLGLFFSLYAVGIMTLLGFAFKSLRWLSFSGLLHMVFVALSVGSFFLAPHKFLNWLFD